MQSLPLAPHNLWLTYTKNVHLIPSKIDREQFLAALRLASLAYPQVRGALKEDPWRIELVSRDFDFQVDETADLQLSDDSVIQPSLVPLLPLQPHFDSTSELSLLKIKLTVANSQTAIGICWHRTLGDATSLLIFMKTLSDLYIDARRVPNVSFSELVFPKPDLAAIEHYAPMMPHLRDACPPLELFTRYKELSCGTVVKPLNWTISQQQAVALKDLARSRSCMPLSTQDCLTAWVLDALGRAGGERLTKITNAASYRNVTAPFVNPIECGNLIYIVPTETIDASNSFAAVAQKIRASLVAAREPKFIEDYMSVASHYMAQAAQKNAQFFWGGEQGVLSVNSHLSLDWNSAHFGSPSHPRFFTTGSSKFYLRVFSANTDSTIFLSFGIPEDILQALHDTLESDLIHDNFPSNIVH